MKNGARAEAIVRRAFRQARYEDYEAYLEIAGAFGGSIPRKREARAEWRQAAEAYVTTVRCDPCAYCGGVTEDIDHIVAASRGGEHGWENAAGVCGGCNSSKQTKSVLAYLAYRRWCKPRIDEMSALGGAWAGVGA